ncbi:MAG: hypothetical protein V3R95_06855 [Dehalococcoidia bacterium]
MQHADRARRLPPTLLGLAGGVVALFVAGLYLAIIFSEQTGNDGTRVALVATALIATAALGMIGAVFPRAFGRRVLLTAGATGMTAWGVAGIFSIGLPLLLAAGLSWLAVLRMAGQVREAAMASGAAAVATLVITFVGLALAV